MIDLLLHSHGIHSVVCAIDWSDQNALGHDRYGSRGIHPVVCAIKLAGSKMPSGMTNMVATEFIPWL